MGEVRTKVKLTNLVDLALRRRCSITENQVRSFDADALVDTGAVRSTIPMNIMELLGVDIFRETTAEFANGMTEVVCLSDGIFFEIDDRNTIEEAFVLGNEVLIGQTVLEKMDLLVDCKSQKLITNPKHPDGPVSKIK